MNRLALVLLVVSALTAIVVLVASRRRRRRRAGEIRVDPVPAGMRQLATHVGALSSFGMGLRLPPLHGHGLTRRRPLVGVR